MTANATRRSGWDFTLVVVLSLFLLIVLPFFYVASIGPTFWLSANDVGEPSMVWAIAYMPLFILVEGTFLEPYLYLYLDIWGLSM